MRLKEIHVTNFKGLKAVEFAPTSFGCLVGENNAGKSSVLQAINYALKRPPSLPVELFYDPTEPLEFSLQFDGVTEAHLRRLADNHRTQLEELVADGQFEIFVRYQPPEAKCTVTVARSSPINPQYKDDAINTCLRGKTGTAVKNAIATQYPEFLDGLADGANIAQAKAHLKGCIEKLDSSQWEKVEGPLPSGISASITKLLPEPIYIPAVKNLGDDLKTTQSTSFGRLLGLLLEDMGPDLENIKKCLSDLDAMLNRIPDGDALVDKRHEKVRSLEQSMESFLQQNFPQAKIELNVPPPELRTILNSAQIYVNDGSRDLIDNKGDGIKRSLTFALLQTYVHHIGQRATADTPDSPAPQPLVFLFEEPELYLHPRSQKVLFSTLGHIAQTHQVVVTTHSPIFFAPGVTAAFVRVAKSEASPKPIGRLFRVEFDLSPNEAEVFRLARFENADAAFFSRRIVLFEGESDDSYCKHVSKLLNPDWDFDNRNIALIRVSGKGNFAKSRDFFSNFGIEVKIVADLDALFEGYHHLGAGKDIDELRSVALQKIDTRIATLGIKAEPTTSQIKDKIQGASWRDRYGKAKNALRDIQETRTVTPETIELLDGLFTWEQEIARARACREDVESSNALVPTIDALRQLGVCVLARGPIEDYYPPSAPKTGSKPERALAAASAVTCKANALALSKPLAEGREPELVDIFAEVFRD